MGRWVEGEMGRWGEVKGVEARMAPSLPRQSCRTTIGEGSFFACPPLAPQMRVKPVSACLPSALGPAEKALRRTWRLSRGRNSWQACNTAQTWPGLRGCRSATDTPGWATSGDSWHSGRPSFCSATGTTRCGKAGGEGRGGFCRVRCCWRFVFVVLGRFFCGVE